METQESLIKELLSTVKYLRDEEKRSKWFEQYLDKVNSDLKKLIYEQNTNIN